MRIFLFLSCFVLLNFSCREMGFSSAKAQKPVEATRTLSKADIQNYISQFGDASFVRNGIKTYSVRYKTKTWDSTEVTASASLIIPDVTGTFSIINHNHGTLFPSQEGEAPSYNRSLNEDMVMAYAMAAAGNIVVAPDYIGYGNTKNLEHNYCDYHNIAINVWDALLAAVNHLEKENVLINGKLYITGYSEGGGVAVATQKKIEEDPVKGLTLSGTAALAGAYATYTMASNILGSDRELPYMNSYAWVLKTYNKTGGINKPLSYYLQEPHATAFRNSVRAEIPLNPRQLFTPALIANFNAGTESLIPVFRHNDLTTLTPKTPLILCHGDKDNYVPFYNSEIAYLEMKSRNGNVKLITYPGKGHGDVMWDFMLTVVEEFGLLK